MNDSAWQIGISLKWDSLTPEQRRNLFLKDHTMRFPKYRALLDRIAGSRFEFLTGLQQAAVHHLFQETSQSLEAVASRAAVNHNSRYTMKNTTTETPKDTTPKTPTPKAPKAKAAKPDAAPKVEKVAKAPKAEAEADAEPSDRLPTTVAELKESKGGLVSFLFHSGKAKEEIATELKAAFKLTDEQAVKIVRRITGRARFFQRVAELMAMK